MSRLKLLPWAIGVALVAVTLVGANRLLHPDGNAGGPVRPPGDGNPVIVHGTVAVEPEPIAYGPSPFLPAGSLAEVYVKDGQEVKAGDALYKFDDRFAAADVRKAEAAVAAAARKYQEVLAEHRNHPLRVDRAKNAVAGAGSQVAFAQRAVDAANAVFDDSKGLLVDQQSRPLPPEEIARKRRNTPAIVQAEADLAKANGLLREAQLLQALAEREPLAERVALAADAVTVAQADLDRAKLAAAECVVKAKVTGVVEQLAATPGMAVGPQTRTPLMWLIPSGPRVVRAEVTPEFASRIENKLGRRATVSDDTHVTLTYEGEVKRVASSFLPKRGGAIEFGTGKPTVVLEVLVEVKDPTPPGKPPLRVGQPVRVSIGQ